MLMWVDELSCDTLHHEFETNDYVYGGPRCLISSQLPYFRYLWYTSKNVLCMSRCKYELFMMFTTSPNVALFHNYDEGFCFWFWSRFVFFWFVVYFVLYPKFS